MGRETCAALADSQGIVATRRRVSSVAQPDEPALSGLDERISQPLARHVEVVHRLAPDPWTELGLLDTVRIAEWTLRVGTLPGAP